MIDEMKPKNKIIAISGQPVTGKSSTEKAIFDKLLKEGYKAENIHVISTGEKFRAYMNAVADFIKNLDNKEILEKLSQTEEMKSIFENEDYRHAFLDSLVRVKSQKVDLSNFSIEQANNMEEFANIRKVIDTLIDKKIKEDGIEINKEERQGEIWLIDSRLAFHNIPEAFSIRLTCKPEVAGKRLFNDKSRGKEDSKYKTIEEAIETRENRRIGEQKRYLKRYGVDLENDDNYDLIIDTSYSNVNDIADTILTCLDCYMNGKVYAKNWTSPKTLLPLQNELDTVRPALYTFDELLSSIGKYGYLPSEPIEVAEVDNIPYIIEGHHRNFAAGHLGKTLVPYVVIAKDDEKIPSYGGTARQRVNSLDEDKLRGHEWMLEQNGEKFSYEDIYPGIYQKIKEREEEEEER